MKTVWLAWWQNGWSYDDWSEYLVGVYSTKKKADTAGKEFHEKQLEKRWVANPQKAGYSIDEVAINKLYCPNQT
jgi:hypothetical protein